MAASVKLPNLKLPRRFTMLLSTRSSAPGCMFWLACAPRPSGCSTETSGREGQFRAKVGLAPVMRDGIEYEFDVCGEMDQENTLQVTKSRCPKLSGGVFPKPGRELADVLKEWLGADTAPGQVRQTPSDAPMTPVEPNKDGHLVNGVGGLQAAPGVPQELASIWKRMCNPRGVVKEFVGLEAEMERLGGSMGVAEYYRILRKHGVDHPKRFKASQLARLCAKEGFGLLEELRRNARENESQVPSGAIGADSGAAKICVEVS